LDMANGVMSPSRTHSLSVSVLVGREAIVSLRRHHLRHVVAAKLVLDLVELVAERVVLSLEAVEPLLDAVELALSLTQLHLAVAKVQLQLLVLPHVLVQVRRLHELLLLQQVDVLLVLLHHHHLFALRLVLDDVERLIDGVVGVLCLAHVLVQCTCPCTARSFAS